MSRKTIVIGLVFLFLAAALSVVPNSCGWNSEQKWGYIWVNNWKNSLKITENNISISFTGEANGKTVNALLIKYIGNQNGYERFNYEGAYYSYGRAKGTLKLKSSDLGEEIDIHIDIKIKSLWIGFSGYFDLVKYNTETQGESVWGLADIFVNYYTKKPLDIYEKASSSFKIYNKTTNMATEFQLSGTLSVTATTTFDNPIPYLPVNATNIIVYQDTNANYNGVGSLNTQGHISMSIGSESASISLDRNLKKDFDDSTWISSSMIGNGSWFARPGIIENTGMNAFNILSLNESSMKTDINFGNYLFLALESNNYAKYDNATSFYSKINIMPLGVSSSDIISALNSINELFGGGVSQQATESDVKNVENNAPSVYGSYQESIWELIMDYLLYIIIGIVVAVAVIVPLVVIRRRKKKKAIAKQRRIKGAQYRQQVQPQQRQQAAYPPPYPPQLPQQQRMQPTTPQQKNNARAVKPSSIEEKLRKLKDLRDEGLLTEEEYEQKKNELLRKEGF